MCGIIAYVGSKDARSVLLEGLKRLEYRGYDSWGLVFFNEDLLCSFKRGGKISQVGPDTIEDEFSFLPHIGVCHTRCSTHGAPNEINAHPHFDCHHQLGIVHNGIIENYLPLKKELEKQGHVFQSETDSEVIAHLLEECYSGDMVDALRQIMLRLVGTFGLTVISSLHPGMLYGARRGSPLIVGVGDGEMFLTSDVGAIVSHTRQVIYLEDNEIVSISSDSFSTSNLNGMVKKKIEEVTFDAVSLNKGGYDHFMLKEIFEQPESLYNAFRGRLDYQMATVKLGGLDLTFSELQEVQRIKILACGTAWHAGLVGKYLFEDLAGIWTDVEYASEFRYRNFVLPDKTLVLAISQSGETADTLAAVSEAKQKGVKVLGICNVVGSSIARQCRRGVYLHAGPEIGVASTKAFTSQVLVLTLLALYLGRQRNLSRRQGLVTLNAIEALPELARRTLKKAHLLEEIAQATYAHTNFLYIGREYQYPIALEGALKLKEISYVHAEGLPAAELKHGIIALIDEHMPTVVLAPESPILDKTKSNVAEIRARQGRIISVITEANREMDDLSDFKFSIPRTTEFLTPILSVIPLQLLAYYIAVLRGCDVDKPRNLAKSVTVE